MAQIRKMDFQVEIKSSADKFYDVFRNKVQLMPKMSNHVITDVKLLQGDWDCQGAVRLWSYVVEGKPETAKEILETVDDKNMTLVFKAVEGEIMNSYKSWKTILNVTPMCERGLVKWTLEFEQQNEDIPDPVKYAVFLTIWTKNIDAFLCNTADQSHRQAIKLRKFFLLPPLVTVVLRVGSSRELQRLYDETVESADCCWLDRYAVLEKTETKTMAQIAKMEVQTEIKSPADKFYDIFRSKMHLMPKICPQEFKDGKLVDGDWKSVGSVREWCYAVAGNTETIKESIEAINDESKTITFNMLDGDVMKYYNTFKPILNVTALGQGCLVKWTLEYEKKNESIPAPIKYNDFLVSWSKNIDAYLLNA
ncbi:MLP-like protein 28 [Durio zibethinus]|uniref:MLP-like protein 28 n=1 Tax=Durio zibethinus TaxID=66656 RepID=A0A6P6BFF9_DURZI|nr:MLP-like protein 28 [Durio zibethinus]